MFPTRISPLSNSKYRLLPASISRARLSGISDIRLYTLGSTAGDPSRHRPAIANNAGNDVLKRPPHLRPGAEGLPSASHIRLSSSLSSSSPIPRQNRWTQSQSQKLSVRTGAAIPTSFAASVLSTREVHSTASPPDMYTASFAFFEALWEAGITHVFVNLGSDHPSIIEAMVKGQRENKGNFPRIITCPNEVYLLFTNPRPCLASLILTFHRWSPCQWLTVTPV